MGIRTLGESEIFTLGDLVAGKVSGRTRLPLVMHVLVSIEEFRTTTDISSVEVTIGHGPLRGQRLTLPRNTTLVFDPGT